MRYYVTSDTHGFYAALETALNTAGFFEDTQPHKLLIIGDLFDRGSEALRLQEFILEQMEKDLLILIKGNHEDMFEQLVTEDKGLPYGVHVHNGTYDTALQLTGFNKTLAEIRHYDFAEAACGRHTTRKSFRRCWITTKQRIMCLPTDGCHATQPRAEAMIE